MWPGFESWSWCHKWVEFVVGSGSWSEGFSPGSPVLLPPQKSTFLNSNSIGNLRAILQTTGLTVNYVTLVKLSLIIIIIIVIKNLECQPQIQRAYSNGLQVTAWHGSRISWFQIREARNCIYM